MEPGTPKSSETRSRFPVFGAICAVVGIAMVVGFRRERAADCASCYSACDHVCPMRLKPRNVKQAMFTCTQCAQCVAACETVQRHNPHGSLLTWVSDEAARRNEATMGLTGSRKESA